MTSLAFWTHLVSAVFYPPVCLRNLWVLNSIASYEQNERVQQADVFKRQTVTFIFEHIFHIYLSIYPIYQVNTREWTAAAILESVVTHQINMATRSLLVNSTFSTLSKFLIQNMYCWSNKTIVTIHRTHFFRFRNGGCVYFCTELFYDITWYQLR